MVFAPDVQDALRAAVALVNSAEEPRTLTTTAELAAFFREHGYTGRHDGTAAYRTMSYLGTCGCFRYDGGAAKPFR